MTTRSLHIHLISDSTGETASSVARAAIAQFEGVEAIEHHWPLIRSKTQMQRVLLAVEQNPGIIIYTMVDKDLQEMVREQARKLDIPCIPVLRRVMDEISHYLGIKQATHTPGKQHELDEEYFSRMEAIHFTLAHDDGQSVDHLQEADIILLGASRTSKTPTCVYLSYKGYKVGNIPIVPHNALPDWIQDSKTRPFCVGLTIQPEMLIQIRSHRLQTIREQSDTSYINPDHVMQEVQFCRRLFAKLRIPVIDVSRRSVEETAANIIHLYQQSRGLI